MKVGQTSSKPAVPSSGSLKRTGGGNSFNQILHSEMDRQELKFSAHAQKRLKERKIDLDSEDLNRLNQALGQAKEKGLQKPLLIYGDVTLVASVPNRTVVTALDQGEGKVFTNIDGAVIITK